MPSQKQIREEITAKIIEALEKGVKPWRRPWTVSPNSGRPMNFVSHRLYQGINPLLLELHSLRFNLRSKWYATYRQWQQLGGQVKARPKDVEPGHWGASIILYRPFTKTVENDKGDQEEHDYMLMRTFVVFNADQVEGKIAERLQVKDEPASGIVMPDYGPAEELISATQADIRHGGDRAYYCRPIPNGSWPNHTSGDYICLPAKHRFDPVNAYYEVAVHELAHWSEIRTGWDHGKQGYAMGELGRRDRGFVSFNRTRHSAGRDAGKSRFLFGVVAFRDEIRSGLHLQGFDAGFSRGRLFAFLREEGRAGRGGMNRTLPAKALTGQSF